MPPLSGFFSKDEILYSAFAGANARPILGVVGLVAAALTAYYTGRLVCLTFLGESRVSPEAAHHLHESPPVMTVPLAVLAVGAVVGGFLPVPALLGHTGEGGPPLALMALATGLAAGGLWLAYQLYVVRPDVPEAIAARLGGFYGLVRDKFRVDELYDALVVRPLFAAADVGARGIDPKLIDGVVNGTGVLVAVFVGVGVAVADGVLVAVGTSVAVAVWVEVSVPVATEVGDCVAVEVGVPVAVGVPTVTGLETARRM